MSSPDIECPDCGGWGAYGPQFGTTCPACHGEGWRPMTEDEEAAAAERQAEDNLSEPPVTLAEQHRAASIAKYGI